MKKRSFADEKWILLCIGLVFVLAAGGIALCVRNYEPTAQADVWNFYGRQEPYDKITRLIREEEADLRQMLEIADDLPVGEALDAEEARRSYTELAGLMQAHGITKIYRRPEMWELDTQYSGGIAPSSVAYQILYTQADPREKATTWNDENVWVQRGNGWFQQDSNIAYLEEVADDLYYFYLST